MQTTSIFMHLAIKNPHTGTVICLHPQFISLRSIYKREFYISITSNNRLEPYAQFGNYGAAVGVAALGRPLVVVTALQFAIGVA